MSSILISCEITYIQSNKFISFLFFVTSLGLSQTYQNYQKQVIHMYHSEHKKTN